MLPPPTQPKHPPREIQVWDIPTRIFHWSLVFCVCLAALTGWFAPEWMLGLHAMAGYLIAGLLFWRMLWGFYGHETSRFSYFVRPWRQVVDHLFSVLRGRPAWHIGHNPAGGWMIIALLATLALIILTGLVALGGEEKQGPLAGLFSYTVGHMVKEVHEGLVTLLFLLIPAHVAGVLVESLLSGENLLRAMVTGRKPLPTGQEEPTLARARPLWVVGWAVVAMAMVYWGGMHEAVSSWRQSRVLPPNPTYVKACGECHWAFHPSLLPETSWHRMLASLNNHFGENAALDAATQEEVSNYLQQNASHSWDTEAANRLRKVSLEQPISITATPYWRKKHRKIADTDYALPAVGSKSNCPACHRDAQTGLFDDQAIQLPKEIHS